MKRIETFCDEFGKKYFFLLLKRKWIETFHGPNYARFDLFLSLIEEEVD
ncbi:hypothetical protein LEP1GSC082_1828 [Leptospira kirschneri str. H2]|nr:hypothetical protein LEP1GSC082_1828 [Leptospira kirschneri str. H2]